MKCTFCGSGDAETQLDTRTCLSCGAVIATDGSVVRKGKVQTPAPDQRGFKAVVDADGVTIGWE